MNNYKEILNQRIEEIFRKLNLHNKIMSFENGYESDIRECDIKLLISYRTINKNIKKNINFHVDFFKECGKIELLNKKAD